MIRPITGALAILLVTAACSSTTNTTTTSTTSAPTPTLPPGAEIAITEVTFGADGQVVITNLGSESVNLQGAWLGQGLSFVQFADILLSPGETLVVGVGESLDLDSGVATGGFVGIGDSLGVLDPAAGEAALFRHGDFNDPDALLSYVQWGSPEGRHAAVAGTAGVWDPPAFVKTSSDTPGIVAAGTPAIAVDAWSSP